MVSLVLFDDQFEVVYHRRDIKAIPALSTKEYYVRGSTALVDAIGRGIRKIVNVYKALGDDNVPEKTVFVITTDGQENASKEFDSHTLKRLVQQQQEKYGWEFMFLGANIDAFATSESMGFKETHTANVKYSKSGMRSQFDVVERALFRYRNDDKNFSDALLDIEGNEEAKEKKKYTSFLEAGTKLPMMYMPDAIRATIELMEAPALNISVRTSYNLAAMSFAPEEIASSIQRIIPSFEISYKSDYRQQIANSWPQSIDDSKAREDWGWKHEYDLDKMTQDMLQNI